MLFLHLLLVLFLPGLGHLSLGPEVHLSVSQSRTGLERLELSRLQKMAKVKATDKFSFPTSLNVKTLFGSHSSPGNPDAASHEEELYDLAAILFHKGPSASHGHYGTKPWLMLQYCIYID